MVADQEPRYRFRDSNGNITGTMFERGGELVLQEGTSGTQNELVLQSDGIVRAEVLTGRYRYAGGYDGGDADTRLDNALSAARNGDTVFLENAAYTDSRTISTAIKMTGGNIQKGARFSGALTVDVPGVKISTVEIDSTVTFTTNSRLSELSDCVFSSSETIEVDSERVIISNILSGGGVVNLNSASENCIVDTSTQITVSDNGTGNVVGDIA